MPASRLARQKLTTVMAIIASVMLETNASLVCPVIPVLSLVLLMGTSRAASRTALSRNVAIVAVIWGRSNRGRRWFYWR